MFGVVFVIGGFVLASMAYINPIIAAMLHVIGSLLVVFNSFRLVRQGEELEPFLAEEKEVAPESQSEAPKPSAQPA